MSDTTPTRLRHTPSTVIPAKAGIQVCRPVENADRPATGREDGGVERAMVANGHRSFL
jgi:hypothetical protein